MMLLLFALVMPVLQVVQINQEGESTELWTGDRDGEPFVDLQRGVSVLLCWLVMCSRLMLPVLDLPKLVCLLDRTWPAHVLKTCQRGDRMLH